MAKTAKNVERKPWDRRADEVPKAYAAFCVYLKLGPGRTMRAAYAAAKGVPEGPLPGYWITWGVNNNWQERCADYDAHLQQIEFEEEEKRRLLDAKKWVNRRNELRERQFQLALKRLDKGDQMVNYPIVRQTVEKDGKTIIFEPNDKWTIRDGVTLIESGEKSAEKAIGPGETGVNAAPDIEWGYKTEGEERSEGTDGPVKSDSGTSSAATGDSPAQSGPVNP